MRLFVVALVASIAFASLASVSEAACGGLFGGRGILGVRGRVADRRAEGLGVFQKNGPLKRAARGSR